MPTKTRRETPTERVDRLAVERGRIVENKRDTAKKVEPMTDDSAVAVHWFTRWQRLYGPNPFLYRGFLLDVSRSDGLFEPNDEGQRPALLKTLPDRKQFATLREACFAPLDQVAERLEVPAEMLTAWESGEDLFAMRHIHPDRLLRLASAFTIAIQAGGPPPPVEPAPEPEPEEAKLVNGDNWPDEAFLRYVGYEDPAEAYEGGTVMANRAALRNIVAGDYPGVLPTLTGFPTPEQMRRLLATCPALPPSFVADLLDYPPFRACLTGEAFLGGAPNPAGAIRLFACLWAYKENRRKAP